mgnify:FL=1
MKSKHMLIMYLAIFLIAEVVFFLNMLKPNFQAILTSLVGAALVSLVIGTMILAAIYLIRKLNVTKE